MNPQTRPKDITIERNAGVMRITWLDGVETRYPLRWLRANCPCASCKEVRRETTANVDMLSLNAGPSAEPSTELASAELVGNYAIRLAWSDGHDSGIYPFVSLRACADVIKENPDGSPVLNYDFTQSA